MKLLNFLSLLAFLPLTSIGQKAAFLPPPQKSTWLTANAQVDFSTSILQVADTSRDSRITSARQYLIAKLAVLQAPNSGINFEVYNTSPYSYHISFYQAYDNVEIFSSQVKINVENSNKIFCVSTKTVPVNNWNVSGNFPAPDPGRLYQILASKHFTSKKVFFIDSFNIPVPAYQVTFSSADNRVHQLRVYSANYSQLYSQNIEEHLTYKDTSAKGMVFFPDPLTTSGSVYSDPVCFNNHDDSDNACLDSQRVPVTFPVTQIGDTFYLQDDYVIMQDLLPPNFIPAHSATPEFNYRRGDWYEVVNNDTIWHYDASYFRDVNVYFQINRLHSYVRSLGYTGLMNMQIPVDANSNDGADNSYFNSYPLQLIIGTGGVPDAEDADVCIHEYTHSLGFSAAPNTALYGADRMALDEGSSDYIACGYSNAISTFHWQELFNWDGHNNNWLLADTPFANVNGVNPDVSGPEYGWSGRTCVTKMIYPDSIIGYENGGDKWDAGSIWAGTMMEAQDTISRERMDKIDLEMFYSFFRYETMPQAAELIMKADSTVYGGVDVPEIVVPFQRHKILPESYYKTSIQPVTVNNYKIISRYFSQDNLIIVQFNNPESGQIDLFDMAGKQIISETFSAQENANIYVPGIAHGIYIMTVTTPEGRQAMKLMR